MTESGTILLRILAFQESDRIYMVCLDTNIFIRAGNLDEAMGKMLDALRSYLYTFDENEILEGKYIRKAPLKYFMDWHLNTFLYKTFKIVKTFCNIEYNPHSKNLQVA
jgi:hypothetical protein